MSDESLVLPTAEDLLAVLARSLRPAITPQTALLGIRTGGAWVAERLHQALGVRVPLGTLDITFYRDDFQRIGLHPTVGPSEIPFDVADRHVILVDDVLQTGRTVRAALNELFDYGRPSRVSLAVLVDRGERELPVAADFSGITLTLPVDRMISLARDDDGGLHFSLQRAGPR